MKKFSSIIVLSLFLTACSTATILMYIELALKIATTATSVSGIVPVQYVNYVDAALGCIEFASTEANSTDTQAIKTTKIIADCSQLTSVVLPTGTSQNIVTDANNIATSIQTILQNLPKTSATTSSIQALEVKFNYFERQKLKSIAKKARRQRVLWQQKHPKK